MALFRIACFYDYSTETLRVTTENMLIHGDIEYYFNTNPSVIILSEFSSYSRPFSELHKLFYSAKDGYVFQYDENSFVLFVNDFGPDDFYDRMDNLIYRAIE